MLNGILNINKPEGITSFDVIRKLKRITGRVKIGHAGTLDPMATGVLPVCIGKATKSIDYIMNESKIYRTVFKLGVSTDTYDREGKVVSTADSSLITLEDINKILPNFRGVIKQIPPMYSALKVQGKRLYEMAREGIEIDRIPREVTIYSLELLSYSHPFLELSICCSNGTYIRSLCRDIGESLGCGACMTELVREKNGIFTISNSIELDRLTSENLENFLITMEDALDKYPVFTIDDYFLKLFINGVAIQDSRLIIQLPKNERLFRVYSSAGLFTGLGRLNNNTFKAEKLFL